jgi:hypothetical protein
MNLHSLLQGQLYFCTPNDVRTSQETPMGFHGLLSGSVNILYVHNVRTSQETHPWDSTACYMVSLTSLLHFD